MAREASISHPFPTLIDADFCMVGVLHLVDGVNEPAKVLHCISGPLWKTVSLLSKQRDSRLKFGFHISWRFSISTWSGF